MRRRLFLGALLTAAGTAAPRVAEAFPYGDSHVFAGRRNGEMIGHHALRFREDGGRRHVATSIDFNVHLLGMAVYKFSHRCHETWTGELFQTLTSETEDNGKRYTVKASRTGAGVAVERTGEPPFIKTAGGDEALAGPRALLPADTLPSTHWNIAQVRQAALLHTEYGKLYRISVGSRGRETIRTATGTLGATRYDYSGELQMSQWFDDRSRWVKSTFRAHDGSLIEYILQE